MNKELELVFTAIQEQIKSQNEATNKSIHYALKGVHGKLDIVIKNSNKQNGILEKHEERLDEIEVEAGAFRRHLSLVNKFAKKWYVLVIIFILTVAGTTLISQHIDFKKTVEDQTGIHFKDSIQ